ncbi:hypothetical protein MMC27_006376 [Xylographa pallens]|nr:hypothetical protein [Xylographa pallens]
MKASELFRDDSSMKFSLANRIDRIDRIDNEMNEDLLERLDGSQPKAQTEDGGESMVSNPRQIDGIREYFDKASNLPTDHSWLTLPELPTSVEVGRLKNGKPTVGEIPVPVNKVDGPWSSKQEYLQSHYELLREDGVASLREAVEEIRAKPELMEKDSQEHAAIYENVGWLSLHPLFALTDSKVYISGVTFAQRGIAMRVEFSLRRAGKMIRWEQSKRLTSGTLVALTPATDMFATVCKVAVVAARPLVGLQQVPPSIDIYFNSSEELEIDPQKKWLMVEARSGFFEAQRHTLRALQRMSCESFPLVEHIVDLEGQIPAPNYIQEQPLLDVSAIMSDPNKYIDINVLDQWPEISESNLDDSQLTALRRILTKRLAIVQGPPGTGKTHVSVVAMKVLLSNMSGGDPPIIVAAQTNHALDQLLRHIAVFEPKFVRLGGRTVDQLVIKPRTLFEIKRVSPPNSKGSGGAARKSRRILAQEMTKLLDPLTGGKEPFTAEVLQSLGLISETQVKSLVEHAENWAGASSDGAVGLIASWLESYLITATKGSYTANNNMEAEEVDLEFEQLKETEAEVGSIDDDSFELLRGEWVSFAEPYTGRGSSSHTDVKIKQLLKEHQNLYRIHPMYRGSIYSYLQRKVKEEILKVFRMGAKEYDRIAKNLQVAKWEADLGILRGARIIGMTTTGLSKYRPLVASLKPRVVLIEEAAETLEAPVTAACFESLQHLILVGDHQQLRGHCSVQDLEGPPFNLDVSGFERLVTNNIDFSQLTRQRRMRPEIRKIISPIYENLQDHPCVEDREDVPGMGGINSFFYTHTLTESNDDAMSKRNLGEADMVISFFDYLVYNGMEVKDITVLTFYNGQRKRILQGLRTHRNLQGGYQFKVATVDSYQGEENEVVILSLVRNNPHEIGFLKIDNRVCVALSRARRGFYLFGNDKLLRRASPLWNKVLQVMEEEPRRIGQALPITCTNHHAKTLIKYPSEWESVNGGCKTRCEGSLSCGHRCMLACHPFDHETVKCQQPCSEVQACGHPCLELCHVKPCRCKCGKRAHIPSIPAQLLIDLSTAAPQVPEPPRRLPSDQWSGQAPDKPPIPSESRKEPFSRGRNRAQNHPKPGSIDSIEGQHAWGAYAAGGHREADARLREEALTAAKEEQQKQLDEEMAHALFGPPPPPPPAGTTSARGDGADGGAESATSAGDSELPKKRKSRKTVWTPLLFHEGASSGTETSLLDLH